MRWSHIPKPPEMPMDYLHVYWANRWANFCNRKAVYSDAMGECIGCGVEGLLGFELKHYGEARPTNLLCDGCGIRTPRAKVNYYEQREGGSAGRSGRVRSRKS